MRRWAYAAPVLIAALFLLPHVLDAHFGLLDDAVTILIGRGVLHEPLLPFVATRDVGRFFPVYLYYYSGVRLVVGEDAAGFYLANLIVLCALVALLVWIARRWGGTPAQCALSGVLLVFALPAVTTFHTLSKAEVPQSLFLALALATAAAAGRPLPRVSAGAVFVVLALWSKETAYAVVGAAGLSGAAAWMRHRSWRTSLATRQGVFLAATLAGAAVAFAVWRIVQPGGVASGSYASHYQVSARRLLITGWDLAAYLLRSEAFLLPAVAVLPFAWRRLGPATREAVVDGACWSASLLAILLPWPGIFEYQMMPAALGLALAGGFLVPALWTAGGLPRLAALAGLALFPLHVVNAAASAQTQMIVDRANGGLVDRLAALPPRSRVFLNMPESEYVLEARQHVQVLQRRPDVSVDSLPYDLRREAPSGEAIVIASPTTTGLRQTYVRVGYRDQDTAEWGRMLADYLAPLPDERPDVVVAESTSIAEVAFQRLLCLPGIPSEAVACRQRGPLFARRPLGVTWSVYRVSRKPTPLTLATVHDDGRWEFRMADGTSRTLRFGRRGDVPLRGDFDGDGLDEIAVFRPADTTWLLDLDIDGTPDRVFRVAGMTSGDRPVVGDWDGNGTATPGFFRPSEGRWSLFNSDRAAAPDLEIRGFGAGGDVPVAGDWFARRTSSVGVYRPTTGELILRDSNAAMASQRGIALGAGGVPVIADWSGMGKDSAALDTGGQVTARTLNSEAAPFRPPPPIPLPGGGVPLAGRWKRLPS